ncbi:MAG: bifunctional phosphoribosyl-AMP cyclohydrolase/phosphoribosyl-ATP diphosphatase HisIE [Bacillaceae bacterium]|nr:bifunctional phosphoribosyl-AMP cyclohydrolase/phosphoribosyl-ATP diphosphatase HisIE [Bacillaceae bacterium]
MIKFDENGLIPAVVQDARTKAVLTLAYMNEQSLNLTLETKQTWFWSRSRQELWNKGATSGNTQKVVEVKYDCDQDAVLVLVEPNGPACHTGEETCFHEVVYKEERDSTSATSNMLFLLEELISQRKAEMPEGSYTTYLFEKGVDKILKKVGEEAAEVIIAAKNNDAEELKWESADLLFHLLVLLNQQNVPLQDVLGVLEERHRKR